MADDMFSKICDICGSQPAILFFRTFNGSSVGEEGLCPQCALKRFSEGKGMDLGLGQDDILQTINEMRHILTDIAGHINKIATDENTNVSQNPAVCKMCKHSSEDIKRFGKVGCSICYDEFPQLIKKRIHKYSYGTKYKGYIPNRFRKQYMKTAKLEKLKIKLHALLREEAYEEAAKINKQILKLESYKTNN